jgi:hydroxymethylpyrimidine pyrophosphatase-like HAD family hydrolase
VSEKIEAIILDIDDCLLSTSGKISHDCFEGLEIIKDYVEEGNKGLFPPISFCTGREYTYTIPVANLIGKPDAWSIVESGVYLYNPSRRISENNPLENPALTPEIKEAFEMVRGKVLHLCKKLPLVFYRGKIINIALELAEGAEFTIEEYCQMVREELREFEKEKILTIRHSSIAIDISPANIDKASGTQFFSQLTGTPLHRILGIGDSEGDFPMLRLVGQVGCPQNASVKCQELIKEKKGYVSPFSYAAGVADIISHFTNRV